MESSPIEKLRAGGRGGSTYMCIGEEDFLQDGKAACLKADSLSSENRERLRKCRWG